MEVGKVSYDNEAVMVEGSDRKKKAIQNFDGVQEIEPQDQKIERGEGEKETGEKKTEGKIEKKNRPEAIADFIFRILNICLLIAELVLNILVFFDNEDACQDQFKIPWLSFTIVGFVLGLIESVVIAVQTYQDLKYGYSKIEVEFGNFFFNFLKSVPQTGLTFYYVITCGCSPSDTFFMQFGGHIIEYFRIWARKFLLLRKLRLVCCQCHFTVKCCWCAFVHPPGKCICLCCQGKCCQGSCCPEYTCCSYEFWRIKIILWNKLMNAVQFVALVVVVVWKIIQIVTAFC